MLASKLGNAADAVQDYLDDLKNKGRTAARVGRPVSAVDQAVQNTASADDLVPEPDTVAPAEKKKPGRPKKSSTVAKKPVRRGRGRPRKKT